MFVAMMHVRKMRMRMDHFCMLMNVAMGFLAFPAKLVFVLMMFVMNMAMLMCHYLMRVSMRVPFSDMKIYSEGHQCACDQ